MRTLQGFTDLSEAAHHYGGHGTPVGILIDHVYQVDHLGSIRVIGEQEWIAPRVGGRAYPIVCGHIVEIRDEDGISDGRCGFPIVAGGNGCHVHNIPDLGECEHGLSKSLCAGPGHYPMDM